MKFTVEMKETLTHTVRIVVDAGDEDMARLRAADYVGDKFEVIDGTDDITDVEILSVKAAS